MKKYSRVYVEITNICNRSCSFCPGTARPARMMTMDEFSLITDKLVGITDYIYLHVMGEPLIHPQLCEFISHATKKGFKCAVTSNGTLLKERADELIGSGIYKLNVSLHSFEDGSLDEQTEYVRDVAEIASRFADAGILTVLRLWNEGSDGGRNVDTVSILKESLCGDWILGTRGARIRPKLHLEYGERFEWPDREAEDRGERVFCHGLGDHFAILSDGTVVPCCLDRDGAVPLGNAYTSDIASALTSERAVNITRGFAEKRATEDLCRRCGYARRFKL